ncbi:MAG: hypothetical protein L6R35_005717 [Caloplaca aegaea]|nr:MAG: hypothetical protein L6R35_005717 [Caloplaca aegaea]
MPLKLKPPSLPNQPPPDAPSSATSAKPKLTIKFGAASQSSPTAAISPAPVPAPKKPKAPRKPKADKPARTSKPTPKKREFDASALAEDDNNPKENALVHVKRLKLSISSASKPPPPSPPKDETFKSVKYVRTKFKGKVPERPVGVGYDSCSSDIERDPALEEEFIFRMQPGEDCEYIRQAIADRKWGPAHEGGADVRMQFLREDGRRAVVSVQKRLYAACFVDLPCVIEGMKSWDKKSWFKTADICQMLMVLGRIGKEEEAIEFPLPKDVDPKTWQYAHGITPPMRYARKRRFRKRISKTAIEAVEEEVEQLLRQDVECENNGGVVKCEMLDPTRLTQEQQQEREEAEEYDGDEDAQGDDEVDAEGDEDIENAFEPIDGNDIEADNDADIEAALLAEMEDDDAGLEPDTLDTVAATLQPSQTAQSDPPTAVDAPSQPLVSDSDPLSAAATPAKATDTGESDDPSSDEDAAPSELDDAEIEQQQERERQWAEVNDMKAMIKGQEEKAAAQPNAILKSKILTGIRGLRRDLGVKLAALGVEEEEEEVELG